MRWDNLFDDLEGQLEAEIGAAERTVNDDEERQRQARLSVHQRLRYLTPQTLSAGHGDAATAAAAAAAAAPLRLTLTSGGEIRVALIRHGLDWCAVDVHWPPALAGHALIPIVAIATIMPSREQLRVSLGERTDFGNVSEPASPQATVPPRLADTISLGFVLRDLARRRRMVEIHFLGGVSVGTLDRVGADHCELAEHSPGDARREKNVNQRIILALAGIVLVRIL